MGKVTLNVNPDIVELKVRDRANLNITTDEGNELDVVVNDNSEVVDLTKIEDTYTVVALKEGKATATVTAIDEEGDEANAVITFNITEDKVEDDDPKEDIPENLPNDKYSDLKVREVLRSGKRFEEINKDLILHATTEYVTLVSVLYEFNKRTGLLEVTNNSPLYIASECFNWYNVIYNALNKASEENNQIRFDNIIELIQLYFVEYRKNAYSYRAMSRYESEWKTQYEKWNITNNHLLTYLALIKIFDLLSNPDTRDQNLALIDLNETLDSEYVLLSETIKDWIKEYYE